MISAVRRALVGAVVLTGLVQPSSGNDSSGLRGLGGGGWGGARALQTTDNDPLCSLPLPEGASCTLTTTAIGMVEEGYATYYDDTCLEGIDGCDTGGVLQCRTCYLSTDLYMEKNPNETSLQPWVMCPCCVPTKLTEHVDVQVQSFFADYNISASDCTDSLTVTPVEAPATPLPTPSPTPPPVDPTPVPGESGDGALTTPEPVAEPTPGPTTESPSDGAEPGSDTGNVDASETDVGLSMGAKVGIGAAAAVGVIFLGVVGYGAIKACRRGPGVK